MKSTISLDQLHQLISDSYALVVNDTLYYPGYDDAFPYVSDNDGNDYVDLSTVDGDIEVHNNYVFFYVNEQPIRMSFLMIKNLNSILNNND